MRVPRLVPARLVHMRKTTGHDARARRRHVYEDRCAQCGTTLTNTTRVAAHVLVYPYCGLPCGRRRALVTACKRCNHPRNPRRAWWTRGRRTTLSTLKR